MRHRGLAAAPDHPAASCAWNSSPGDYARLPSVRFSLSSPPVHCAPRRTVPLRGPLCAQVIDAKLRRSSGSAAANWFNCTDVPTHLDVLALLHPRVWLGLHEIVLRHPGGAGMLSDVPPGALDLRRVESAPGSFSRDVVNPRIIIDASGLIAAQSTTRLRRPPPPLLHHSRPHQRILDPHTMASPLTQNACATFMAEPGPETGEWREHRPGPHNACVIRDLTLETTTRRTGRPDPLGQEDYGAGKPHGRSVPVRGGVSRAVVVMMLTVWAARDVTASSRRTESTSCPRCWRRSSTT